MGKPLKWTNPTSDYFSDESPLAKARYNNNSNNFFLNLLPRNGIHSNDPPPKLISSNSSKATLGLRRNQQQHVHDEDDDGYNKSDFSPITSTPIEKGHAKTIITTTTKTSINDNHKIKNLNVFNQQQQIKEINQNQLNTKRELHNSLNNAQLRNMNDNKGGMKNLAYLDYKKKGEYWNNTPKTDYTYSKLSRYRRELAPGVVAMPNMSRHGLEHIKGPSSSLNADRTDGTFISRIGKYVWWPKKQGSNQTTMRNDATSSSASSSNTSSFYKSYQYQQSAMMDSRLNDSRTFLKRFLDKLVAPFQRSRSDVDRYTYKPPNSDNQRRQYHRDSDSDYEYDYNFNNSTKYEDNYHAAMGSEQEGNVVIIVLVN